MLVGEDVEQLELIFLVEIQNNWTTMVSIILQFITKLNIYLSYKPVFHS